MISATMVGAHELAARWQHVMSQFPSEAQSVMNEAILYVHSTVPAYPAPPSGSHYRRTGTLGRSITTDVRPLGGDVVGVIGSNVIYAPYVIDANRQAHMHAGRWWTLQAVIKKALPQVMQSASRRLAQFFTNGGA